MVKLLLFVSYFLAAVAFLALAKAGKCEHEAAELKEVLPYPCDQEETKDPLACMEHYNDLFNPQHYNLNPHQE